MARTGMVAGVLVVAVGLALIGAKSVPAQIGGLVGPERQTVIYDGDLKLDSGGIDVSPWGSGTYESVYDETYVGPEVLKVTSQGPYQGIVLRLNRPADLSEFAASGNGYLDLRLLPAQGPRPVVTPPQTGAGAQQRRGGGRAGPTRGGARGGAGRPGGGGMGGGLRGGGGGGGGGMGGGLRGPGSGGGGMGGGLRGPGGGGGGGMGGGLRGPGSGGGGMGGGLRGPGGGPRGGLGGPGGQAARTPATGAAPGANQFRFRNLRVVLFTDEGVMVADSIPVDGSVKDQRGWVPVSVALSDFKGAADASTIRAVGVFVDESDVFYVGRVGMVVDRSAVRVTLKATPSVTRVDNVVEFTATLKGGPIAPKISWDFDKSDGIQRQAVGGKVKYAYKEPGDYLVTCTIADKSGVRAKMTQEIGVRVEGSE